MAATKVKALCVATRCTTAEQFVAMFHRFSDEKSFFVATLNMRPVGLETAFAIQLANRAPVLRGTCVVLEAWTTSANPFQRPGIRLGFKRLTPDSDAVFRRLQTARAAAPPAVANQPIEVLTETPVPIPLPPSPSVKIQVPPIPPPRRPTTMTITVPPKSAVVEPTVVEPPKVERTPGSELVLPANPLMNLTDESLEGFVDCTLYEETANFFRSADDGSDIGELAPPPKPPPREEPPPPLFRPISMIMPAARPPELLAEVVADDLPPPPDVVDDRPTPVPVGEAFPVVLEPPPARAQWAWAASIDRRWWIAGAATFTTLVIIVLLASRSSASGDAPPPRPAAQPEHARVEPPPAPTPPPAPAPKPPPKATARPVAPAKPAPPDPAPVASDGTPVVGEGPCRIEVTTTPAGTMVTFDGRTLGPSPIAVAGTCDHHDVELAHPRYKTEKRAIAMTADKPASLDVTLVRPTHSLKVITNPPGANVFIAGRLAGTSPTAVQIMGFTGIDVKVERAGYAPVTSHVYSKAADEQLAIALAPLRRR